MSARYGFTGCGFFALRDGGSGACATLWNIKGRCVPEGLAPDMAHRRGLFGTAPVQQRETQNTPMFQSNFHDPTARAQRRGPVPGCGQGKGGKGRSIARGRGQVSGWRARLAICHHPRLFSHPGARRHPRAPCPTLTRPDAEGGGRQGVADRWPATDSHQMSACPAGPPPWPPLCAKPRHPGPGNPPTSASYPAYKETQDQRPSPHDAV